jgi:predicted AAA+ superfamily ATPase
MWFKRDIETSWNAPGHLEVRILTGPRQCGKSALLDRLMPDHWRLATLDDLQSRQLANQDPGLFLEQLSLPAVIDEMQYAPPLFPEVKRRVDDLRRVRRRANESLAREDLIWATGSNQIFFDRHVKESLAGRASYFTLHPLSFAELRRAFPELSLETWLLRGGWPELYASPTTDPIRYLDDYVRTYLERDIVVAAGIQKISAFSMTLGLIAARTGSLLNLSDIAAPTGVEVTTVSDWIGIIERAGLCVRLPPYHSNLNKRLVKTPKIHVTDIGLAARLQGWREPTPAVLSPQIGGLFESAVVGEVIRTKDNFRRDWQLFFWRTKESEEIDLIVSAGPNRMLALEVKFASQSVPDIPLTPAFCKTFPNIQTINVVTWGGEQRWISKTCRQIPLQHLGNVLLHELG